MGIAKMQADGSCVSTFCFSISLHIGQGVNNLVMCKSSTFIYKLAAVSRADRSLIPALRQYLFVGSHFS
jgi:hypothetical protein